MNLFKTPILFLIFNRLDTTKQVFEIIKKIEPCQLFIATDGPREDRNGEDEICLAVREYVINNITWQCEVKTLFREENLGCKLAVSEAIDWFFENVEEGIILEDDCLPDITFFDYCRDLLELYRHNNNVFMISGDNFLPKSLRPKESYYFSHLPHIWGWATWRRAWKKYDVALKDLPLFIDNGVIKKVWNSKDIQNYWLERFEEVYNNRIDTWDYQWAYAVWKNNGVSISPSVNLISNIGFGSGTHTLNINDRMANLTRNGIKLPLQTCPFVIYDKADDYENQHLILKNSFYKKILAFLGLLEISRKVYSLFK